MVTAVPLGDYTKCHQVTHFQWVLSVLHNFHLNAIFYDKINQILLPCLKEEQLASHSFLTHRDRGNEGLNAVPFGRRPAVQFCNLQCLGALQGCNSSLASAHTPRLTEAGSVSLKVRDTTT